jgi:hypothetical protein
MGAGCDGSGETGPGRGEGEGHGKGEVRARVGDMDAPPIPPHIHGQRSVDGRDRNAGRG